VKSFRLSRTLCGQIKTEQMVVTASTSSGFSSHGRMLHMKSGERERERETSFFLDRLTSRHQTAQMQAAERSMYYMSKTVELNIYGHRVEMYIFILERR
jgi:hypothetical protein